MHKIIFTFTFTLYFIIYLNFVHFEINCIFFFHHLEQGPENYALQTKSSLVVVFMQPVKLRNAFTPLYSFRKNQKSNNICCMENLHKIPTLMSVSKALLEHSHAHLFTWCP
jgi:hypothetical protein